MQNYFTKLFFEAMSGKKNSNGATITAKFRNGSEGVFSADMFDELKQDGGTVYIIDSETGEALYIA